MIGFKLSPEQQALRSLAASFASNVLSTAPSIYEKYTSQNERFRSLKPIYQQAVTGGLIKGLIPKALGGTGGSLLDAAILVEEMYAADTSAALTIFGTGLGLSTLMHGGSSEHLSEFLKPFLSGEGAPLASLVYSEPTGTANWLEKGGEGLQTVAWQDEKGDWVISGEKMWATNSSGWDDRGAELQCVVCRYVQYSISKEPDRQSDPRESIMILLVTPEIIQNNRQSAYQVLSHPELAGLTATSGPRLKFDKLCVPAKNVLAKPGHGVALVEQAFTASAVLVGAMAVSIMRTAYEVALKFAKEDTRGGAKPIISRQSVADLLMNVKMNCDASRALTWAAGYAVENGCGPEMALEAKIFSSDIAVKSVTDAMSAVGMSSYTKDSPFPKLMNDAICLPLFDGGNVGVRRRHLEKIIADKDYEPWKGMLA